MEKIKINWDVSSEPGSDTFNLDDLECETIEEWEGLSKTEQDKRMQETLDSLPEQPYKYPVSWEIK